MVDLYGAPAQRWAVEHLARNGTLVALTTFPGEQFAVSSRELVQRQLSLLGSRYNSRHEVGLAASLVSSGRVRPVVSVVVGPDDVAATLDAVRAGTILGRAALAWLSARPGPGTLAHRNSQEQGYPTRGRTVGQGLIASGRRPFRPGTRTGHRKGQRYHQAQG